VKRRLLITGGAGFIGCNLTHYWVSKYPQDEIIVLDALTYAGCLTSINNLISTSKINFIHGDINDKNLLTTIFEKYNISHILHLAAESHVDRSIDDPSQFIRTNIQGTFSLLESFRSYWQKNNKPKDFRFLHVSTDEVFGSLSADQKPFNEKTAYDPKSPYSSTKAASDHLAMAWQHTYGLPILLSNCSNNYGPFQFPEKLIPLTITNIINGKEIPIYGNGENVRDWLFVQDHCRAIEEVILNGSIGKKYCIGGCNQINNIQIVNILCKIIDKFAYENDIKLPQKSSNKLINFVEDRPGHDYRYEIDSTNIRNELGWSPSIDINDGLYITVEWYLKNHEWWRPLLNF
tara:strand:+ start:2850 stop:3890 length:1041 start_codon:yes stop_codon:yes gene_type:complete